MNKSAKKKVRKANYDGYSQIDVEASTMQSVYEALPKDFNIWDWVEQMNSKGYDFSFEIEADTEFNMCVLKSVAPENADAGIYLFTTSFNPLDALVLTWYKYTVIGGGKPLVKATPRQRSVMR